MFVRNITQTYKFRYFGNSIKKAENGKNRTIIWK